MRRRKKVFFFSFRPLNRRLIFKTFLSYLLSLKFVSGSGFTGIIFINQFSIFFLIIYLFSLNIIWFYLSSFMNFKIFMKWFFLIFYFLPSRLLDTISRSVIRQLRRTIKLKGVRLNSHCRFLGLQRTIRVIFGFGVSYRRFKIRRRRPRFGFQIGRFDAHVRFAVRTGKLSRLKNGFRWRHENHDSVHVNPVVFRSVLPLVVRHVWIFLLK